MHARDGLMQSRDGPMRRLAALFVDHDNLMTN